jgi:hypothetical protein
MSGEQAPRKLAIARGPSLARSSAIHRNIPQPLPLALPNGLKAQSERMTIMAMAVRFRIWSFGGVPAV